MALKTKKEIVQELIYEAYGGMPDIGASISENFVLREVNNVIAELAIESAFGTYNLDGCVCADDIFILTYSNLTLTTDSNTGNKYFTHPAQPIGIPSKRAMQIYPPANRGGVMSSIFKPISRAEATKVRDLPKIKKVFHYTADGNEYFIDSFGIMDSYSSVNLDIMSSGANDLTAFLNLPDSMINKLKGIVLPRLRNMMALTDTTPLPASDNPVSRSGGV